jgi:hypothetical protein
LADNWRKLLDFDLMYHRAVAQLEQDFADLQRQVGRDLHSLPSSSGRGGQPYEESNGNETE